MFKAIMNKGFHITFSNGVTISVQWGSSNYCNNRSLDVIDTLNQDPKECKNAEIMIWKSTGDLKPNFDWWDSRDNVRGYCTPEQVLEAMNWAASLPIGFTLESVKRLIEEIEEASDNSEMAHGLEDELRTKVLQEIANGNPEAIEMAKLALTTGEMDFDRWYA